MKKVVVGIFILAVLLISGFARASVSSIPVTQVKYDVDQFKLHISGYFSNPCQIQPSPSLVAYEDGIVTIAVVAKSSSDICVERLSGRYDVAFDLRSFLSVNVPSSLGKYIHVKIANTLAVTEPIPLSVPDYSVRQPFSNHEISGELVELITPAVCGSQPQLVIMDDTGKTTPVAQIPFVYQGYLNKYIHASGLVLQKTADPVMDENTANCGEDSGSAIFVTGLSASKI